MTKSTTIKKNKMNKIQELKSFGNLNSNKTRVVTQMKYVWKQH